MCAPDPFKVIIQKQGHSVSSDKRQAGQERRAPRHWCPPESDIERQCIAPARWRRPFVASSLAVFGAQFVTGAHAGNSHGGYFHNLIAKR